MRKRLLLTTFCICSVILSSISANASTSEEGIITKRISPEGEVIMETLEEVKPDEEMIETILTSPSQNPTSRAAVTYSCSTIPCNNYTILMSVSSTNISIQRIIVSCTAFYSSGAKIGSSTTITPTGWQTMADNAKVKVPTSALNLKVASGYGNHQFINGGATVKTGVSSWKM